jgi:uncharacterized NAD(P)/FAD-binding protein YdhS
LQRRTRCAAFGHAACCREAEWNSRRLTSPLLAALIRDGDARACASGLGITTGEVGRVVDASGVARSDLFALGVLCRAGRWETTSVPDIVRGAVALARC